VRTESASAPDLAGVVAALGDLGVHLGPTAGRGTLLVGTAHRERRLEVTHRLVALLVGVGEQPLRLDPLVLDAGQGAST